MGRLFGTNGIRGVVGESMTPELALGIGKALGSTREPGDRILVGRDTRVSGPMLQEALMAGILSTGVDVLDAGVAPTPALQLAVGTHDLAAGVILTASHNPPEYNGIKCVSPDGSEFFPEEEVPVEDRYLDGDFRVAAWDALGERRALPGVNGAYVDAILARVDRDAIREAAPRVVVDCANGASCFTTPELLRRLGCDVVTLNAQPDGTFPGHPSEPTPTNVADLVAMVAASGADLGVVHDGDADRAIFVDETGAYVWGDRTLALVAGDVVTARGGGTVITPVSSSSAVEEHVRARGGDVTYTAVGSPRVAKALQEDPDAVFGGEENGGLVFPEHQVVRDGAMSLAKILEILARTGRPFSELLAELPAKATEKLKTPCPDALKPAVLEAFRALHEGEEMMTLDGVKLVLPGGWVLVRPSGTEAIVRVYAEADDEATAAFRAQEALAEVQDIIDERT